jgi:hypothetical protein
MSIISFALTDICSISRRKSPSVAGSGTITGAETVLYTGIKTHISANTRYWTVTSGGGVKHDASHVAFFEADQDIAEGDTLISSLWGLIKFKVLLVDRCCGFGQVWFQEAYLQRVSF